MLSAESQVDVILGLWKNNGLTCPLLQDLWTREKSCAGTRHCVQVCVHLTDWYPSGLFPFDAPFPSLLALLCNRGPGERELGRSRLPLPLPVLSVSCLKLHDADVENLFSVILATTMILDFAIVVFHSQSLHKVNFEMNTPSVDSAVGPRRNLLICCVSLLFFGVLPQRPECREFYTPSSPQLEMRPPPFMELVFIRQKRHTPLGTRRSTAQKTAMP